MAESYIISIDQSTQGTKALLFNQEGVLLQRNDLPHRQIVNEKGWVSHDPEEIYQNTVQVVKNLVEESERQRDRNQQSERNVSDMGEKNRKSAGKCSGLAMCKGS